jgi:integrase
MPTQFIKGFSEPHHGGRIRKTKGGKFCAERSEGGKFRRAFFDTKSAAKDHLSDFKARRNKQGKIAMALTSDETKDAIDAFHRLKSFEYDIALCEAVDFYRQHHPKNKQELTLEEALTRYESEMENPRLGILKKGFDPSRPESVRNKRKRLNTFLTLHAEKDVREITKADVQSWVDSFGEVKPRTILNRKTELQSLFNFTEKILNDFTNEVCKQKQPKKSAKPAEIITPATAEAMLRNFEADNPPRYAVTFALMCFAGIRPHELTRPDNPLTWECIDFENKQIEIPSETAKTEEHRYIPIQNNLLAWLTRYPGKGRIAPSSSRFRTARTNAMKAAKLSAWPSDGARHSFGTYMSLIEGAHRAAGWMGHSGGISVFKKHYEGRSNKTQAKEYFNIMPKAKEQGQLIKMEASA